MILQSGYFSDFAGGPKILIWGEPDGMYRLTELLRTDADRIDPLALDPLVQSIDNRAISLRVMPKSQGMQICGNGFEWRLDLDTITTFAEMIDPLAVANCRGHQFLECGVPGEICVMASCAEYLADLRPDRHAKTRA